VSAALSESRPLPVARRPFGVLVQLDKTASAVATVYLFGVEIIKHRKDTSGLDEAEAIVIELGREIFGARRVTSATFARSLQQFGRRALVDLVALMGNYAGTAALLTAFDMQLDPGGPQPLPSL